MGTPEFAVPSLELLIKSAYEVAAVVTQPDKPKGRGMVLTPTPVKVLAQKYNIPIMQPVRIKEECLINKLKDMAPAVIVVAAYGKILPKAVLDIPRNGCINVHASILPKYRGAAPINRAIINGEKETGITTMLMDEGMDTGMILLKEVVPIFDNDTAGTLHDKLKDTGARLLIRTLDAVMGGTVTPVEQDSLRATYAPMLKKEDCHIDWGKDAVSIRNLVRGLKPLPCAYTYLDGKLFKIYMGEIKQFEKSPHTENRHLQAGAVIKASSDSIDVMTGVKTGNGIFSITELKPENKNRMTAKEFLRGCKIVKGQIFN